MGNKQVPATVSFNQIDVGKTLFEVKNLSVSFIQYMDGLRETRQHVVKNFNLTIRKGEVVAVFGPSGAGKSLLANAILGILPEHSIVEGEMKYKGEVLSQKKQIHLRGKKIALIPQSVNALDPLIKVGKQVQTVIKEKNKQTIQQTIFRRVGLNNEAADLYPFQLSGGMARRVLIAIAMASDPELIIADEPTPGLDVRILQETMKYLRKFADEGKGILFITHDMNTAINVADKIAILYEGEIIEIAKADDFRGKGERLCHPYTKALWNALPQNDFNGELPDLMVQRW